MEVWFNSRHRGRSVQVQFSDWEDPYDGFVLDYSSEWVLLRYSRDYRLWGYSIIRRKNIKNIRMGKSEKREEAVIAHMKVPIGMIKDFPLNDLKSILTYLTKHYGVFSLCETREDVMWLGSLHSYTGSTFITNDLDTDGRWNKRRGIHDVHIDRGWKRKFRSSAIRLVEFETDYINGLKLVDRLRRRGKWNPKAKPKLA